VKALAALLLLFLLPVGCGGSPGAEAQVAASQPVSPSGETAVATFAGGCFWCMEAPFDRLPGVLSTTSGYTAGHTENPSYEEVSSGATGHTEAVEILYDPEQVSYGELLDVFWHNIDPVTPNAQFCDHGSQYRSGIYTHDAAQRAAAEASRKALDASGRLPAKVVTEIEPVGPFYAAEDYHQDYYEKNPIRYKYYRRGCGRDARLAELWGSAASH